jgi:hypothetical protein
MSSAAYGTNQSYISQEKQKQLYKRTLLIVSISQMFGGAGLAAGITVGALLAQQMFGTDAVTGIPSALLLIPILFWYRREE